MLCSIVNGCPGREFPIKAQHVGICLQAQAAKQEEGRAQKGGLKRRGSDGMEDAAAMPSKKVKAQSQGVTADAVGHGDPDKRPLVRSGRPMPSTCNLHGQALHASSMAPAPDAGGGLPWYPTRWSPTSTHAQLNTAQEAIL